MAGAYGIHRACGNDSELSLGGTIGPANDRSGNQNLIRFCMRIDKRSDDADSVSSHCEVNGIGRQGIADPLRALNNVKNGCILDQHRDDNLASLAYLGNRGNHLCACRLEGDGCLADNIIDGKIMSRTENTLGHSLAHPPQTDKPDFHFFADTITRSFSYQLLGSMPDIFASTLNITEKSLSA